MRQNIIYILALVSLLSISLPGAAKDKYSYYFQRAEEYYEKDDFDQALHYLEQGVEANPKDGICWAVIAEIYSKYAYARYAEALEASGQALKYLKDKWWKGFVYNIQGDIYYKIDYYKESRTAYEQAIALNPDNDQAKMSLADVCQELGDYDAAIRIYQSMIDEDYAQPYLHASLGYMYIKQGAYDKARQSLKTSLALYEQKNKYAYAYMGKLALAESNNTIEAAHWAMEASFKGEYNSEAKDLIDTLIQKDFRTIEMAAKQRLEAMPTNDDCSALLYVIYSEKRLYPEALYYLKRTSELNPSNAYHYPMARIYMDMAMYDEAAKEYEQVLESDSSSTIYGEMAILCMLQEKYDEAYRLYEKAISMDKDDATFLQQQSKIWRNQGMYEKSIPLLEKGIAHSQEKHRSVFYLNLGEAYMWMGETEKAKMYLEMCLETKVERRGTHTTLGIAAATLGDKTRALEHIDSLKVNTQPDEYEDIAMIYTILGDTANALHYIQLSLDKDALALGKDIRKEFRYRALWNHPDFIALAEQQAQRLKAEQERLASLIQEADKNEGITQIPFTINGGVNQVRCVINGLPLYFVFDTGAADVTISSVEANFMLKNGYLTDADFLGKQNYVTATGEIHEGTIINLKEVRVGDITLENIKASVVNSQHAPLLLGQTVFRRFGTLEVDNEQHLIIFRK